MSGQLNTRMNLVDLVLFKAYAELRAEASRYYLSMLWWVFEPVLALGVYYVVFGLLIARDFPDYVPYLLIGIAGWQWFERSLLHSMTAIYGGGYIMNQVNLPKVFFPAVYLCVDSIKFSFVISLVLVFLWTYGMLPNVAYVALPLVLLVEFVFIAGMSFLLAALMPFIPDMKYLVETVVRLAFFASGVLIPIPLIPQQYRFIIDVNPMAQVLEAYRGILMYGQWPDWQALAWVSALGLALLGGAVYLIHRLEQVYPRYLTK